MKHNTPPALILASGSAARKAMLDAVHIPYTAHSADLDEEAITQKTLAEEGGSPAACALRLAQAKALAVAPLYPDSLVIGSDQVLACEGTLFSKATDAYDAKNKLRILRGKTHQLISAVCVVQNTDILWSHTGEAHLTMRDFDDLFLEAYAAKAQDALCACVGAYKIEGLGVWLFSAIEGDHFTIMGMPLLPLLTYLHDEHGIVP